MPKESPTHNIVSVKYEQLKDLFRYVCCYPVIRFLVKSVKINATVGHGRRRKKIFFTKTKNILDLRFSKEDRICKKTISRYCPFMGFKPNPSYIVDRRNLKIF